MAARPGGYASSSARADRRARIEALWKEGLAPAAIAERIGMSHARVTEIAAGLGLHNPRRRRAAKNPLTPEIAPRSVARREEVASNVM